MNLSKKRFSLMFVSVLLSGMAIGYGVQTQILQKHGETQLSANVWVFKETFDGNALICSGNILTDDFEHYVANIIGFNNVTGHNDTKWIALGNGSIAQTKHKLDTEATASGFGRTIATTISQQIISGDYVCNYTKKFTCITATIWVNATGLHWDPTASTSNNMAALASLGGYEKFEVGWNCTIVWSLTYNAN